MKAAKTFQVILVFLCSTLIFCKPLKTVPKASSTNLDTVGGDESLPNLRKILYPTYAREPYGTDFYTYVW